MPVITPQSGSVAGTAMTPVQTISGQNANANTSVPNGAVPGQPTIALPAPIQQQRNADNAGKSGYDIFGNKIDIPPAPITAISSDKSQTIADNNKNAETIMTAPRGTLADPNSIERYTDNTPAQAPADAVFNPDMGVWQSQGKNYLTKVSGQDNPIDTKHLQAIADMQAKSDALMAEDLGNIRKQYEDIINTQKDINTRGEAGLGETLFQTGASRYSASASGITQSMMTYGLGKLGELVDKENSAITEIKKAYQANDQRLLEEKLKVLDDIKSNQNAESKKLYDNLVKANQDAKDRQQKIEDVITTNRNSILQDLAKVGNVPQSIINGVKNAASVADMIAATDGYLQTSTDPTFKRYIEYKNEMRSNGFNPSDFSTWKQKDDTEQEKQKSSLAEAEAFATAKGKLAGEGGLKGLTDLEYAKAFAAAKGKGQAEALFGTPGQSKEDAKTVIGVDPNTGRQIMVTMGDAKKMGLTNIIDAPSSDVSKTFSARQWMALVNGVTGAQEPEKMGILDIIDKLDEKGKLGPIASRWNEFLVGKYGGGGDDKEANKLIETLRTKIGLSQTLLMNLHVGSRGGAYMLEHFEDLADAKKLDADILKAGVKAEINYAQDRSMLPSTSTGGNDVQAQTEAKKQVLEYSSKNPKDDAVIDKMVADKVPYSDILNWVNQQHK